MPSELTSTDSSTSGCGMRFRSEVAQHSQGSEPPEIDLTVPSTSVGCIVATRPLSPSDFQRVRLRYLLSNRTANPHEKKEPSIIDDSCLVRQKLQFQELTSWLDSGEWKSKMALRRHDLYFLSAMTWPFSMEEERLLRINTASLEPELSTTSSELSLSEFEMSFSGLDSRDLEQDIYLPSLALSHLDCRAPWTLEEPLDVVTWPEVAPTRLWHWL